MKNTIIITLICLSLNLFSFNDKINKEPVSIQNVTYNGIEMTIITIKKNSMDFSVSTKNSSNNQFYLNSNFFTPSRKPIGEVITKGKKINGKSNRGGFFYTINGNPMISLGSHPKGVENSSQTNYVGIINGNLNKKLVNKPINKEKAYRTLVGKNENGDLLIIVSTRFGMISMGEISKLGIEKGIKTGLIFDGGSSVDVGVKSKNTSYSFKSVPSVAKKLSGIDEPPVYIVGNFKNN